MPCTHPTLLGVPSVPVVQLSEHLGDVDESVLAQVVLLMFAG